MQTRTHISLGVSDLAASVKFYKMVFNTEPTKMREDFASFRLDTPALHLSLVPAAETSSGMGMEASHFGVELFDQDVLDSWQARVEASGATPIVEEEVTCCYARANKFWLTDPDGRPWEFWVRTAEAEAMAGDMPIAAPVKAAGCCEPAPVEEGASSGCCP